LQNIALHILSPVDAWLIISRHQPLLLHGLAITAQQATPGKGSAQPSHGLQHTC
jgi:hypothetical protein